MQMFYRSSVKLPNEYTKRLTHNDFEVYEFYSEKLEKYYYIFKCIGPHLYIVFNNDEIEDRKQEAKNLDRIVFSGCCFDFNTNDKKIINKKRYLTDIEIKNAIDSNIEVYKRKDIMDYMKGETSQVDVELEQKYLLYNLKEEVTIEELIDFLTFMKQYDDKFSQSILIRVMLRLIKNCNPQIHVLANIFCEQIFSDVTYPIKVDFTILDEMINQIKNTKTK